MNALLAVTGGANSSSIDFLERRTPYRDEKRTARATSREPVRVERCSRSRRQSNR
jgi:hypothetical protein